MTSNMIEPIIQAAIGGFMLNMMNLYHEVKIPPSDRVRKDLLFWIFFLFWPIAGALLAYIYISSGYNIKGWLAFTTGLTVPTTIQSIIDKGSNSKVPFAKNGEIEE
ncbi:hypothetical protein GON26_14240 [Flavobacterium sp. GA093]|uniref:Uncharacterized protein n=1 Tax=Flavobacterium hydrocarbonoxydans TaxID=2683249 RepID=A0A6I4NM96_9FLAO|nr:hypothetical protein [Flavobacterium hydrocarbonoxydans]MWB95526.1 hypothetical protein [Flavobacterium hydrocarbonoxydans]